MDVIVQFVNAPTPADTAKVVSKGGAMKKNWSRIRGSAFIAVPVERLKALRDDPSIAYISANRKVTGQLDMATVAVGATSPMPPPGPATALESRWWTAALT